MITNNASNMIRAFNLLDEHESSDDESDYGDELETDKGQECISIDSEESESESEDEICAPMIMNPDETESELAD